MILEEQLYLFGNIICLIGTLLLIRSAIKDRKKITGVDTFGAFLTFLACCFFIGGYYISNQYFSLIIGFVTVLFWLFVISFKIIYRKN